MSRLFSLCRTIIVIATMLAAGVALADRVEAASLRLSWSDNSSNESGFKIERRAAGGSYAQLATVGANVTSYTDSGLTSGRTYCYTVRAFNSAGTSAPTRKIAQQRHQRPLVAAQLQAPARQPRPRRGGARQLPAGARRYYYSLIIVFSSLSSIRIFWIESQTLTGFTAWVDALNSGFPKADMIEIFMDSGEFRIKGKFIAQTYLGILRRDADYGGFRDCLDALLQGMSRKQIVQYFLNSTEFKSQFGSNLTNGEFVKRMYANVLLRAPDTVGYNYWVGQLNNGKMTRAQVALSFLDSAEFQNLAVSQNRVDVSLLYFDMLRRDPDAGGFSAWVDALNTGVPLTSVIDAFLMSGEYQARF